MNRAGRAGLVLSCVALAWMHTALGAEMGPEPAGNSPFLAAVMVTLSGLAVALLPGEALIVASAKIL